MNDKYETIKSILLVFLVVTSGVLTWNLWTFQPTYDVNDEKHVHEVSISDQKDIGDVIVPVKLLFHFNKEHYGIVDEQKVEAAMEELSSWIFYDLGEETALSREQINKLFHQDYTLELIFPDLVPFDLYKGILHFETKDIPTGAFDRILIQQDRSTREDGTAYFISTKERKVYESHVSQDQISTLFGNLDKQKNRFDLYEPYELPDGRIKYLPAHEPVLSRYKYFSDYIEAEKFKKALFKDPSIVRKDTDEADNDRYKDGSSRMDVDHANNMIFYVNPSQMMASGIEHGDKDLLKKSINFINEHAGWTDNYKYFGLDPASQKTTFQLFLKGYPVFNCEGMSEMKVYWGKEDIYQYSRPYFTLDIPLPDATKVNLLSGEEAMDLLLADPDIQIEKLQELILGYRILKDPENPKVLILDPSWYYLYDGSWQRLESDGVRGEIRGLG